MPRSIWLGAAVTLWGVAAVGVLAKVAMYGLTPASPAPALGELPTPAEREVEAHFFVHPRCPCTAASVEELDRLLARAGLTESGSVTAHVYRPLETPDDWADTAMIQRLKQIPSVVVEPDPGAGSAARFGAAASGHLMIYRRGRLVFSGGITPSRGHQGDSASAAAALTALRGEGEGGEWRVYGCGFSPQILTAESAAQDPTPE